MTLPARRRSRITRIVTYDGDLKSAYAPQSVAICLADEIDISRGDILVPVPLCLMWDDVSARTAFG